MHFSSQQDVAVPIAQVFDTLTQFDIYERAAMRRGADVVRKDTLGEAAAGAHWQARFMLRGKERDLAIEIATFQRPTEMVLSLNSSNLTGAVRFELFALSKSRTRMTVETDIRPLTLSARLFVKSLSLTKPALNKRYSTRIADLVADIEARNAPEA